MAFTEVELSRQHTRQNTENAAVRAACYISGKKHTLAVIISPDIRDKLGWTARDYITLAIGSGADKGMLRFTPSATHNGIVLSAASGTTKKEPDKVHLSACRVVVPTGIIEAHFTIPAETRSAAPVVYQVFGSALTIIVPDWCVAREEPPTRASSDRQAEMALQKPTEGLLQRQFSNGRILR